MNTQSFPPPPDEDFNDSNWMEKTLEVLEDPGLYPDGPPGETAADERRRVSSEKKRRKAADALRKEIDAKNQGS